MKKGMEHFSAVHTAQGCLKEFLKRMWGGGEQEGNSEEETMCSSSCETKAKQNPSEGQSADRLGRLFIVRLFARLHKSLNYTGR